MRKVNIAELKARLSMNIRRVREGEEVLVCERNTPVARIVPCDSAGYSDQEKRLIARGALLPSLTQEYVRLPKPIEGIADEVMAKIWQEEREGR